MERMGSLHTVVEGLGAAFAQFGPLGATIGILAAGANLGKPRTADRCKTGTVRTARIGVGGLRALPQGAWFPELDSVAARLAPRDQPHLRIRRIAERHRRAGW
jgi:hypothetical protein